MLLSSEQVMLFWRLWSQGWKVSDRDLRLRVCSVAVSFPAGHFRNVLECLAFLAVFNPASVALQDSFGSVSDHFESPAFRRRSVSKRRPPTLPARKAA